MKQLLVLALTLLSYQLSFGQSQLEFSANQLSFGQSQFETNSSTPTKSFQLELIKTFNSKIKNQKLDQILIEGYADIRGNIPYNLALSKKRAESVANLLISLGVEKHLITVVGFGKDYAITAPSDKESFSKSRRVVIITFKTPKTTQKTLISNKTHKNIVSITATRSQNGLTSSSRNQTEAVVTNKFDNAVGIMYQRQYKSIYFGASIDTNDNKQVSIGYGFD